MLKDADKIRRVKNKFLLSQRHHEELEHFSTDKIANVLSFQKTHKQYAETPLVSLNHLSKHLNLASIQVKDESKRFGLNAFKVMGGIYAIGKYIADKLGRNIETISFEELQSEEVKEQIGNITFISATDGNHGRGVAWAARELGQKSIIYMPKGSSESRLEAIRNEGAEAKITNVNYDETIKICASLADENGYVMVQDTAWEGYEEIPLWIMQGYASIAMEITEELEKLQEKPPTHIFLQAGVGSFAASIAAYFLQYYGVQNIKIIIIEPDLADCYYRSFANNGGNIEAVTGDMNSIMAGLCCGEPNIRSFKMLKQYAHSFYSCPDSVAALGMRVLGNPISPDEKIISGESGAIPLGLLYYLRKAGESEDVDEIGLNENSRVLFINTEGNTDPQNYLDIVWKGRYSN